MVRRSAVIALVFVLVVASAASADPGDLDDSFSVNGKVTTVPGGDTAIGWEVAIAPDGKVVVAGYVLPSGGSYYDFGVVRYNSNGTLDTTFSGDGIRLVDFLGYSDYAYGVAVQPNGKIVVVGASDNASGTAAFAVARLRMNGTLDPTFSGDGKVRTAFPPGEAYAYEVSVRPDGKLVVGGEMNVGGDDWNFALTRYKPGGALDLAFGGGDGRVTTDFFGNTDGIWGMALQDDGKIVAVGWANNAAGTDYRFAAARYTPGGSLDGTFSGDGKVTTNMRSGVEDPDDYAYGVGIRPDGKIVVGGYVNAVGVIGGVIGLLRYRPNGTLDTSFGGGDGKVIHDLLGTGHGSYFEDLALQGDGRIVVVGRGSDGDDRLLVGRFLPGGAVDTGFGGGDGYVLTTFGDPWAQANGVAIQSNGRIVAAGYTVDGGDYAFAVARYLP